MFNKEELNNLFSTKNDKIHEDNTSEGIDESKPKPRRSTVLKRHTTYQYRRAFSETKLLDLVSPEELIDGASFNFITGGDVDALSYLKLILRAQPLDYVLASTWCMAQEDIFQFKDWHEEGLIKKADFYVGEIFPGTYKIEYKFLKEVAELYSGRVAVFRNHSKIFAGIGQKFAFGIQTSANINTNPRTENGCIQIGSDIYNFYKDYFDGIVSFE